MISGFVSFGVSTTETLSCKQTAIALKPLEILKAYFLFSLVKANIAKTSSNPELKEQPVKFWKSHNLTVPVPKTLFKKERSCKISELGIISKSCAICSLFKETSSKSFVSKFIKVSCLSESTVVKELARTFVKGFLPLAKTSWLFSSIKAVAAEPKETLL